MADIRRFGRAMHYLWYNTIYNEVLLSGAYFRPRAPKEIYNQ